MPFRLASLIAALVFLFTAVSAAAEVRLTFHSFNGSVMFGRYPHTFVSMEGSLSDGTRVKENWGFSARNAGPAVLRGPVEHIVMTEEDEWLAKTNRHFTIPITDDQYRAIRRETFRWRDAPGKYYSLDTRNCIHFVGTIGKLVGLKVEYPQNMLRRPKKWLNHIGALNPQLKAKPVK